MTIVPIDIKRDLKAIKEVAGKAFVNTPDAALAEWFSFSEMQTNIRKHKGLCLKAVAEKENIVGMIYAEEQSPINGKEGSEKWVISIVAVAPEVKGQSIGSQLLKAIESEATARGVNKMFTFTNLNDEKVINFYKKNGYEDAGWIKDYQYGKGNSAIFLIKYLG